MALLSAVVTSANASYEGSSWVTDRLQSKLCALLTRSASFVMVHKLFVILETGGEAEDAGTLLAGGRVGTRATVSVVQVTLRDLLHHTRSVDLQLVKTEDGGFPDVGASLPLVHSLSVCAFTGATCFSASLPVGTNMSSMRAGIHSLEKDTDRKSNIDADSTQPFALAVLMWALMLARASGLDIFCGDYWSLLRGDGVFRIVDIGKLLGDPPL